MQRCGIDTKLMFYIKNMYLPTYSISHVYVLAYLYRVTLNLANSQLSKDHGGEVGHFLVQLEGTESRSKLLNVFK